MNTRNIREMRLKLPTLEVDETLIYPNLFFRDNDHYKRFKIWSTEQKEEAYAPLYLLTADLFLWHKVKHAVNSDILDFTHMCIDGADLDSYVLFITARDLYKGTGKICLRELVDSDLVSELTFRLILTSLLIRRYGLK